MIRLLLIVISAILWRWGGNGAKQARTIALPLILSSHNALVYGSWWYLLMALPLYGAFTLPYGENHPYWQKALTALAWVIPALFLGHWFALIVVPIFLGLYWLSNNPSTSSIFKWEFVEGIVGAMIGDVYA